ncbi:MAG TPA: TIM barrel protein [Ruminiclostridium sp.]|nr:TIM barrel protein [Ruminiclostridium sp.]
MEYLNYCNLGLVYGMAEPNYHSFESLKKVLQDPFFSAIEVRDFWSYSENERRELQRMLEISLMEVVYETQPLLLYHPEYNLNTPDYQVRSRTIERFKGEIDAAVLMKARSIILTSGKYLDNIPEKEQLLYLVDSFLTLSEYAQARGIRLLVEPFDRSIDKKMFIGPPDLTLEFAREVHKVYSNFGLLIDCGRFPLFTESRKEILYTLQDYIMQVHIGNCVLGDMESPVFGDKHPRFGYSGSHVDAREIAHFLKDLLDINFLKPGSDKIISLEARPVEGEEPELIIANLKRVFQKAWKMYRMEM